MINTKLTTFYILILFYSFSNGQIVEFSKNNENVIFHLGMRYQASEKKSKEHKPPHLPFLLIIDNQGGDTVSINNFNNFICHKYDRPLFRKLENNKTFTWEFLTLSNQIPNDILVVTGWDVLDYYNKKGFRQFYTKKGFLFIKFRKKVQIPNQEYVDIIIPPNSSFVADINLLLSSFMYYSKGYYKLCLYYKDLDGCVAEIIIKNETPMTKIKNFDTQTNDYNSITYQIINR